MAQTIDRFKTITLTQGGADAFVQSSFSTDILPSDGEGWLISLVELRLSGSNLSGLSADSSIEWSITRDTKTAISNLDDLDAIYTDGFANSLTTSGEIFVPLLYTWVPPEGTVVVEPTIYAQFDSAGTGLTMTGVMRVHYTKVKLSEVEILRLINNA